MLSLLAGGTSTGLNAVKGQYASAWSIDHLQGAMLKGGRRSPICQPSIRSWCGATVLCQSPATRRSSPRWGATLQAWQSGGMLGSLALARGQPSTVRIAGRLPTRKHSGEELGRGAAGIIKALWMQRATVEGKRTYRVKDAHCEPKPDPMPSAAA